MKALLRFGMLVLLAVSYPVQALQHAMLVQNSGWMEPFYTDQASQLKPLVDAVARTVTTPDDRLVISAFNHQTADNPSPVVLYAGVGGVNATGPLGALGVAHKSATAMADTDFKEAVVSTITGPFEGRPGILWIFTNNRNSPNNDPETAERNRDFYRLIHLEPSITRVLAFPLRMPVKGPHFRASGLMVYALAYGDSAAQALNELVVSGRLSRVFTLTPALLKPLNLDPVRLTPREVRNTGHVRVSLMDDGSTIAFDMDAGAKVPEIKVQGELESLFFPYDIVSAQVQAVMRVNGTSGLEVPVSPGRLSPLPAGGEAHVDLQLPVPAAMVPSAWSFKALSAMGKRVLIPATIEVTLTGQRLQISEDFKQSLARLFPGDPLSEVFLPPDGVTASVARIPVLFRIQYPLLPVAMVVLGFIVLLIGGVVLGLMLTRPRRYEVWIDDSIKRVVTLKPFGAVTILGADGKAVGTVRRGFGAPHITKVDNSRRVVIR